MRSDSSAYVPQLDGLRALAAIAVLGFHCGVPWLSGGSLGVDVFFVLSGWLITGILVREADRTGKIDAVAFFQRRARRLLPALGLVLTATLAVLPAIWPHALAAGTYTMNFVRAFEPHDNPLSHTWTLAGEMQFYLLWPLVISWLAVKSRASAAKILLAVWFVMTVARCAWVSFSGHPDLGYFLPLFRSTGLLLGAAMAIKPPTWRVGRAALAMVLGLLVFAEINDATRFTFLDPIIESATALLILDPPSVLAWRPFVWIGKISYGVYLWHFPLHFVFIGWSMVPQFVAVLVLSLAFAAASYIFVERRFLTRRAPAMAATARA